MVLRLLIDAVHADETRVVIADNSRIHDFDFVTAAKKQVKGNIYLAKITRVEPSLQAAFVEYGGGKQGFLPFAEIHPDYYQIPMADRKRLLEEAEDAEDEYGNEDANISSSDQPSEEQSATQHAPEDYNQAPQEEIALPFLESAVETQEQPLPAAQETPVTYSEPLGDSQHQLHSGDAESPVIAQPAEPYQAEAGEIQPSNGEQGENGEAGEVNEIETLASDEDAVRQARPASFYRRYKIQEVIKRNQIVLVQVIKEERGNKGVSLTTFMSLAGRYCVLMPNSPKGGGISRKISSGEDRKRLKEISAELKTARGMSAIIRTAGIDRTRAEIKRDYEYLVKLWEGIRAQTLSSTAPALIYEEGDLIKRTIRDLYSGDIEEIIVEGAEGFKQAKDFLAMILPSHAPRVKLHQNNIPLFYAYNIEDQLASMYDPIVKLRSGGYIVLDPTEALISIDVNSGRSTGERNIEETATKTNLEAVAEIARQLRLRDLAGLIVIDLIDMMDSRNRRSVERALKDALKLDRAKIQLGRISPFGLLEMSRQRLRPSISEASTMPCPHCLGKGVIRSNASVSIQIIRAMEKEAAAAMYSELKLTVPASVALHLLNTQRAPLTALEQKYEIQIVILTDDTLAQGTFRLEKIKGAQIRKNGHAPAFVQEPVSVTMDDLPLEEETAPAFEPALAEGAEASSPDDRERQQRRGKRGGRNRRGGRNFNDRNNAVPPALDENGNPVEAAASSEPREARPPREPREPREPRGENAERGERNGKRRPPRRWRDRRPHGAENGASPEAAAGGSFAPTGERSNAPQYQPSEPRQHTPRPAYTPAQDNAYIPPLDQQAPQDGKAKKGWWRRIVES